MYQKRSLSVTSLMQRASPLDLGGGVLMKALQTLRKLDLGVGTWYCCKERYVSINMETQSINMEAQRYLSTGTSHTLQGSQGCRL